MNIIFLTLGSVLSIFFIVFLIRGKKYDEYVKPLEGDAFPLKSIYIVGFVWQEMKFAKLRGQIGAKLRRETTLLYSEQYSEYYALVTWAQILSLAHFFLAIFLLLAGVTNNQEMNLLFLGAGILITIVTVYYFSTYNTEKIKTRREACDIEFPNAISKLALLVNSGLILRESWKMVAYGSNGVFYELMQEICIEMDNGKSDIDAIYDFGVKCDSPDIKKFSTALIQSIEKGGGELSGFLANQSNELWNHKKQLLLQKGEAAAGQLLMPIAIMFGSIMMIIMAAALQSFSL